MLQLHQKKTHLTQYQLIMNVSVLLTFLDSQQNYWFYQTQNSNIFIFKIPNNALGINNVINDLTHEEDPLIQLHCEKKQSLLEGKSSGQTISIKLDQGNFKGSPKHWEWSMTKPNPYNKFYLWSKFM